MLETLFFCLLAASLFTGYRFVRAFIVARERTEYLRGWSEAMKLRDEWQQNNRVPQPSIDTHSMTVH